MPPQWEANWAMESKYAFLVRLLIFGSTLTHMKMKFKISNKILFPSFSAINIQAKLLKFTKNIEIS